MLSNIDALKKYRTKLNAIINTIKDDSIMMPGAYTNLSNEEYHSSDGLSNSGIKLMNDAPYKYFYEYLSGERERNEEEKRSLVVGQAIHTASLEPDFFNDRFIMKPEDIDRRTNVGKEKYKSFEYEASGKSILTATEFKQVQAMAKSVRENKGFSKIIAGELGHVENSIYWHDNDSGALLKSRPDFYNHFMVLDLKSTKSAKPSDFEKAIFNYGYHTQAALALDGLTRLTGWDYKSFVILAVEKEAPYLTALYLLDKEAINEGRKQYKKAAQIYKECKESNTWPAYPDKIIDISLPAWAISN